MDNKKAEELLVRVNAALADHTKLVQDRRKKLKKADSRSTAEALEREIEENIARRARHMRRLPDTPHLEGNQMLGPLQTVRDALQAYVNKDRVAIEAVIGEPYSFTSPIDNAIDRSPRARSGTARLQ